MFLSEPPDEKLSLPDFRAPQGENITSPSVHLLDTIHACEIRQEWYRNHILAQGWEPLVFAGSVTLESSAVEVAKKIAAELMFNIEDRSALKTWDAALTEMVLLTEQAGILVMRNGIVGNNTTRPLDSNEFSGFALADDLAPLIFINGKDSRARQMFTLAHEIAHIWLGQSGLSLLDISERHSRKTERWCNSVAAELLVPMEHLKKLEPPSNIDDLAVQQLARHFKVSNLVILLRLRDGNYLTRDKFIQMFKEEIIRLGSLASPGGGGDFYRTQVSRTGGLFARAVVVSAMEGQTLYRDAYQMLGIKKQSTFDEMARSIGVIL